jgi:hypothetical protein
MTSTKPLLTAHALAVPRPRRFDSDRVEYFEKAGWRAYYDRRWLRVLRLMVQLNREQFAMSPPARSGNPSVDIRRPTMVGTIARVKNDPSRIEELKADVRHCSLRTVLSISRAAHRLTSTDTNR